MTGYVLIGLGIIALFAGVALLVKGMKEREAARLVPEPSAETASAPEQDKETPVQKAENANAPKEAPAKSAPEEHAKKEEAANPRERLGQMVDMAVADGVITQRERQMLTQEASKAGVADEEVEKWIRQAMEKQQEPPETEVIDQEKRKGNRFEEWVVSRFNRDYFALLEWAGDKYHKGRYAETTRHPDLHLSLKLNKGHYGFAVECKYRSSYAHGGVKWAEEEQIMHYQAFAKEKGIPVFVALGIGGQPDAPEEVFIIPLNQAKKPFFSKQSLNRHKRNAPAKSFYYQPENQLLR